MANEDVIPVSYFDPEMVDVVKDFILSLPLDPANRQRIFMAWANDTGFKYKKEDLDIFR